MDRQMDGWIDRQTDGSMDEGDWCQMDRQMDGQMDGWTDWMDGSMESID